MEKSTIFKMSIFFAMILFVSVGCGNNDYKSEEIDEHFYVLIEYPIFQEVFTEGFPKEIKAQAFLGETELNNNVSFIWSSDIDGEIAEGKVFSTEYLSIGEHLITLNAYFKNSKTASETIGIKKVNDPIRRDDEPEAPSPRRVTDRVDGTVYIDNRDGTVIDTTTHLMWEQSDDGYQKNIYAAYKYCEELDLSGNYDWRMPTVSELEEISNIGRHKKEHIICQVFDTKNSSYWTQTKSRFKLSDYPDRNYYKAVKFTYTRDQNGLYGETISPVDASSQRYVRCVR